MNDKQFLHMSFGAASSSSAPLGSSDFHGQGSCYDQSTLQDPGMYQRGTYQHPQNQYPAGNSLEGSTNFHSSDRMSSQRVSQTSSYPESSQRTFLGETMRDNMGYNSVSNSFDAPPAGSSSTSSSIYDFSPIEVSPSPVDHLRFPQSRPSSQQGTSLSRKLTTPLFPNMQLHPPSDYYPSTFSQPMAYSNTHAGSGSQAPSFAGHSLTSRAENNPPVGTSSYQDTALTSDRLSNSGTRFNPNNLHLPSSALSIPQSTSSIPMRKASSEWMTQNRFLPVPKHGIGIAHKRYTSPAVATGSLLPDTYLGVEARASDHSPQDAETYVDPTVKRMASPAVPSHPTSSKSVSPAPPEGQSGDGPPPKKKKKSKMHACEICNKKFPRPSGLKTHMNTHNNARPYPCGFPGCNRTFGVRSNAKRHLRTHGVVPPPPGELSADAYVVGFSTPVVAPTPDHELDPTLEDTADEGPSHQRSSKAPFFKLRWMPPSLTNRSNADSLRSVSENGEFSDDEGGEDEEDDYDTAELTRVREASRSLSDLSIPHLSPSRSSSATGSPDCSCTVPCGATPCLSFVASTMAISASRSTDSFADAVPRSTKDTFSDELGQPSSQLWGISRLIHAAVTLPLAI
ncbi:hypothetical protein BKA70DRAFT_1245378 [Coprinopsis sp. MPI-PUGE-AT-0042]|nr:hypothetical protein BKA70DRAFT_1245378 [Coprinopsis sp. MPI-PUGE-AT-0042]